MTPSPCIEKLRKRAAAVRTRAAIRSWKYRQRNLAAGVWFQVRRSLANACEAWEIPVEVAEQLIADGGKPEEWTVKLEPPKIVLFLDRKQIDCIAARRRIPVRLGPDFLLAPAVALVSFSSKSYENLEGQKTGATRSPGQGIIAHLIPRDLTKM